MNSIRWIRQILIDGQPSSLEILIGTETIGDKCYARINRGEELWFQPMGDTRESIVQQGLVLLHQTLEGHAVTTPEGEPFTWTHS